MVWLLHSGLPRPNDPCFFQRIVSSYRMVKENRIIRRGVKCDATTDAVRQASELVVLHILQPQLGQFP